MIRNYFGNLFSAILGRSVAPAASVAPVDTRGADKATLAAALHDSRFEFRTIGALVKAIGKPEAYALKLLAELGARQAYGKPQLWGAADVVGATPRGFAY